MKLLTLLLAGLVTSTSYAGTDGHGGDVVVCGKVATLYDVYEAEALREIKLDLGPANLSVEQKVNTALTRLERLDPVRAKLYQKWAKSFMSEAQIGNFDLEDVLDGDLKILPPGCEVHQLVIQQKPNFTEDKYYVINARYWSMMDNNNKAATILHEIIYREAIARNQKNSVKPRYFNSQLFSKRLDTMSPYQYQHLLDEVSLGSPSATYGGALLRSVQFYKNGLIREGVAYDTLTPPIAKIFGQEFPVYTINFYETGAISYVIPAKNIQLKIPNGTLNFEAKIIYDLVLKIDGSLNRARFVTGEITVGSVQFKIVRYISYSDNGQIQTVVLPGKYRTTDGKYVTFKEAKEVKIHPDGSISYDE